MLTILSLLLFFSSLYGGVSAVLLALPRPTSQLPIPPSLPTSLPLPTPPPQKRAENDILIGSRTFDGKPTTSKCQSGSTFTMSGIYAGCVAPGEQPATACAENHQTEQSVIVEGFLWCTSWCFSKNKIFTAPDADPFTMMNCLGDYKLSRYVDAETTGRTEDVPDATPTAGSGDTGITTIPESVPPTSSPSAENSDKKDGLSQEAIVGLAVSIPGTIATIVGVWVTIIMYRRQKRKSREGTLGFDDRQSATSLISLGRQS